MLSQADYRLLRTLVQQQAGIDLLDVDGEVTLAQMTSASRLDTAAHLPNEKLSGVAVARDRVLIGSPGGSLDLAGGRYAIPPGSCVSCHYSALQDLNSVVLIENLEVMYALDRYQWPQALTEHVMLFRGSPQHSPAAVSKALDGVNQIISFPDYDPQGLMNSLTLSKTAGIVLPSRATITALIRRGLNKIPEFRKQEVARSWLVSNAKTYPYVQLMLDERLALSQEAMLGHELVLDAALPVPGLH